MEAEVGTEGKELLKAEVVAGVTVVRTAMRREFEKEEEARRVKVPLDGERRRGKKRVSFPDGMPCTYCHGGRALQNNSIGRHFARKCSEINYLNNIICSSFRYRGSHNGQGAKNCRKCNSCDRRRAAV